MRKLLSGGIFSDGGAANTILASLTGAGLAVTLVLAAIILAAAVFAVISIVKRRKNNKSGCHGCGGSCSSCGMSCPVKQASRSEDTDGKTDKDE